MCPVSVVQSRHMVCVICPVMCVMCPVMCSSQEFGWQFDSSDFDLAWEGEGEEGGGGVGGTVASGSRDISGGNVF